MEHFHVQDGLFFKRWEHVNEKTKKLSTGVTVTMTSDKEPPREDKSNVVKEFTFIDRTWASIISAVSVGGHSAETYHRAIALHNKE